MIERDSRWNGATRFAKVNNASALTSSTAHLVLPCSRWPPLHELSCEGRLHDVASEGALELGNVQQCVRRNCVAGAREGSPRERRECARWYRYVHEPSDKEMEEVGREGRTRKNERSGEVRHLALVAELAALGRVRVGEVLAAAVVRRVLLLALLGSIGAGRAPTGLQGESLSQCQLRGKERSVSRGRTTHRLARGRLGLRASSRGQFENSGIDRKARRGCSQRAGRPARARGPWSRARGSRRRRTRTSTDRPRRRRRSNGGCRGLQERERGEPRGPSAGFEGGRRRGRQRRAEDELRARK